jgi:hypothetical protein
MLGGLLSAHVLQEKLQLIPNYQGGLLKLAEDLGRRLSPAFDSETGIPYPHVNLRHGYSRGWVPDAITTAEAGTLTLEFLLLTQLTGDQFFADLVSRTMTSLRNALTDDYLAGTIINIKTLRWT